MSRFLTLLRRAGLLALTSASLVHLTPAAPAQPVLAATPVDVSGWAPYWLSSAALTSFTTNVAMFGELSPFFYTLTSPTTIDGNGVSASTLTAYKNAAASAGKPLIPAIFDGTAKGVMAGIFADPVARAAHVQLLVDFVTVNGFGGIDIDYEQFAFADGRDTWAVTRPNWVAFITELSTALHALGKKSW